MALTSLYLAARCLAFALLLGVFAGKSLPYSARIALAAVLWLWLLPSATGGAAFDPAQGAASLEASIRSGEAAALLRTAPLQPFVAELAIGMLFAAAAGAGLYTAALLGNWLWSIMAACFAGGPGGAPTARSYHPLVPALVSLVAIRIFISTPGLDALIELFSSDFVRRLPAGSLAPADPVDEAIRLIAHYGSGAFKVALLFLIPAAALSLLLDFFSLLWSRYFRQMYFDGLVISAKIPTILLLLGLGLYGTIDGLSSLFSYTVGVESARRIEAAIDDGR